MWNSGPSAKYSMPLDVKKWKQLFTAYYHLFVLSSSFENTLKLFLHMTPSWKDYWVDEATNAIIPPSSSQKIYLMSKTVHLLKNTWINLLHNKRVIFPKVILTVSMTIWMWRLVKFGRKICLMYTKLAPKLSYRALHPSDNKRVSLINFSSH